MKEASGIFLTNIRLTMLPYLSKKNVKEPKFEEEKNLAVVLKNNSLVFRWFIL
jgi:hypothetical protein